VVSSNTGAVTIERSSKRGKTFIAVASQRNNLVKEYNAASKKFNWAPFQTKSDKPPESYQDYVVK